MKKSVIKLLLASTLALLSGQFVFCNINIPDKDKDKESAVANESKNNSKYLMINEAIEKNKSKIQEFFNSCKEKSVYDFFQSNNTSAINYKENEKNNILNSASKKIKNKLNEIFIGNE